MKVYIFLYILYFDCYSIISINGKTRDKYEPLVKNTPTVLKSKHKLEEANGETAKFMLEKCDHVFSKNNGWIKLLKISSVHNGIALNINMI
jgi:hypothetical protein